MSCCAMSWHGPRGHDCTMVLPPAAAPHRAKLPGGTAVHAEAPADAIESVQATQRGTMQGNGKKRCERK